MMNEYVLPSRQALSDTAMPATGQAVAPVPTTADRPLLPIAAAALVLGLVLQVVMEALHPSNADPNDSVAAFHEYAASETWTAVHIGQFIAALLVALALVALSRRLARQPGLAGVMGAVGGVAAVLLAAVFAVQMAVDGVALKATVDAWAQAAAGAERASAFQVAEGIRWIEKGLSGFFHLTNGTTLLALGLSITVGRVYPRWLGVTGVLAGIGFLAGGVTTAHTGFSPKASTVLLVPLVLGLVFLIGVAVMMWRRTPAAS
jgi:hypothetical protein